jgi:predicted benzoate:H+ symporter BenE
MQNLWFAGNSAAVVIAVALVLVVGVVVVTLWTGIGDSEISPACWIAMGFGVIITLALGIGLMTLVFISNRRGYDELGRTSNTTR